MNCKTQQCIKVVPSVTEVMYLYLLKLFFVSGAMTGEVRFLHRQWRGKPVSPQTPWPAGGKSNPPLITRNVLTDLITGIKNSALCQNNGIQFARNHSKFQYSLRLGSAWPTEHPRCRVCGDFTYTIGQRATKVRWIPSNLLALEDITEFQMIEVIEIYVKIVLDTTKMHNQG